MTRIGSISILVCKKVNFLFRVLRFRSEVEMIMGFEVSGIVCGGSQNEVIW